jgi:transcriptional regulator with XRE-family HTH domain
MGKNPPTLLTPGAIIGRRVAEERKRQGLSQNDLVERLAAIGRPMDRSNLGRIERGETTGQLDNVVSLAIALGIAPVHLLVPRDDEEMVELTPTHRVPAKTARSWFMGAALLPDSDPHAYVAAMSDEEQNRLALAGYSSLVLALVPERDRRAMQRRFRNAVAEVLSDRAASRASRRGARKRKENTDA